MLLCPCGLSPKCPYISASCKTDIQAMPPRIARGAASKRGGAGRGQAATRGKPATRGQQAAARGGRGGVRGGKCGTKPAAKVLKFFSGVSTNTR